VTSTFPQLCECTQELFNHYSLENSTVQSPEVTTKLTKFRLDLTIVPSAVPMWYTKRPPCTRKIRKEIPHSPAATTKLAEYYRPCKNSVPIQYTKVTWDVSCKNKRPLSSKANYRMLHPALTSPIPSSKFSLVTAKLLTTAI
jgi:hypothetical protein